MVNHIDKKKYICNPNINNVNVKDVDIRNKILNDKGSRKKRTVKVKKQKLEEEIKLLKEENERLRKESKTTINNDNRVINVVNININPSNDPNTEFLTDKDYVQCINRMIMSVPNLIKKIHFNPKHPENHNIYISNIRNKMAMTYDGNQWNLNNQENTINKLITDHEYMLEEWLDNGEDRYPKAMDKFKKYLKLKDEDGVKDTVKEEIKLLLYNNRNMIKTMKLK
jgi:hypothetical protein